MLLAVNSNFNNGNKWKHFGISLSACPFVYCPVASVMGIKTFLALCPYNTTFRHRPKTSYERPEGKYRYSSTLSSTSALDGVAWLRPRSGHLTPREGTRYSLSRRLFGSQDISGPVRKISLRPGFDLRTVKLEANCYSDCQHQECTHDSSAVRCVYVYKYYSKYRGVGQGKEIKIGTRVGAKQILPRAIGSSAPCQFPHTVKFSPCSCLTTQYWHSEQLLKRRWR